MTITRISAITQKQVSSFLSPRPRDSHKGQFGTVGIIGGGNGMIVPMKHVNLLMHFIQRNLGQLKSRFQRNLNAGECWRHVCNTYMPPTLLLGDELRDSEIRKY